MKQIILLLVFSVSILKITAQGPALPSGQFLSQEGIFDTLYNKDGKKFPLSDLFIQDPAAKVKISNINIITATPMTCGYFNLYFEVGSGMEDVSNSFHIARRNVICQLMNDVSNFIVPANPANKVDILIRNINSEISNASTANVLGAATSFYSTISSPNADGGIIDGMVWKTINSGNNAYTSVANPLFSNGAYYGSQYYHGYMVFNFSNPNIKWYTDLTNSTQINSFNPSGSNDYDLYTVALHELTHALGFNTLIDYNGSSLLGNSNPPYFSRYDSFLKTASGQSVITNTTTCSLYNYTYNSSAVLSPNPTTCGGTGNIPYNGQLDNTTCATAIKFVGSSINQAVYTPDCYERGSSLSHFEDECPTTANDNKYFVMSNAGGSISQSLIYMKRYLKPEERSALCDIGYTVNCAYGNNLHPNNFYNYGCSGTCEGLGVAGTNDGINSNSTFAYNATVGSILTIPFTSILANDFQSVNAECFQKIIGSGTFTVTTSPNELKYTPTSGGLTLFRYVPVATNGKKGNITYIFINTNSNNCTSSCNMVSNGNFESVNTNCIGGSSGILNEVNCWQACSPTPDLFGRACSTSGLSIPVSSCSTNNDTWNNGANSNNHFLGFFNSYYYGSPWSESVQNKLASPLIPGTTYSLKFYSRVNCINSNYAGSIAVCGSPSTLPASPYFDPANPIYTPLATNIFVPNDNLWHPVNLTFTYSGASNLNNLIIGAKTPPNTDLASVLIYTFIDDVELTPISNNYTFTPPSTICLGSNLSNLAAYVSSTGGTFSGPGVSFSGGVYSFNSTTAGTGGHIITYTYTNPLGCVSSTSALITVNSASTLSVTTSQASICSGNSVILNAYTANTYSWSPSSSLNSSSGQTVVASPTITTTYTVTGNNGCSSTATGTITITVNSSFTLTATATPSTICAGQTTSLSTNCTTCGTNIFWSDGGSGQPYVVSPTATTVYTVTAQGSSCVQSAQITVTVIPSANITATVSNQNICSGQSTNLSATGATSYTWTPSGSLNNSNIATPIASPTVTTTYTVTGSNSGCSATSATVLVNVNTTNVCSGAVSINSATTCTTTPQATNFGLGSTPASMAVNANVTIGDGTNVYAATLTCSDVKLAGNVKIIINTNATLTVNTSWLHSCCGMWAGFEVKSGGKLILTNNIIEDAVVAVNGLSIFTGSGIPDIQINHCLFNKNGTAVNYQSNSNNVTPTHANTIKDCIFTSRAVVSTAPTTSTITGMITSFKTDFYLNNLITYPSQLTIAGARGTYGVRISDLSHSSGYILGRAGTTNTTTGEGFVNIFDNLDFGVYATNSSLNAKNNIFQNCTGNNLSGTLRGVGVFASVESEQKTITLGASGSATSINYFKNNLRGVEIEGYQINNIINNNFYNAFTDAWVNFTNSNYTTGQYGIYIKPLATSATLHTINVNENTIRNCAMGATVNRVTSYNTAGYNFNSNSIDYNATNYFSTGIFLEDGAGNNPTSTGVIDISGNTIVGATYFGILTNYVRKNLYIHDNNEVSVIATGPTGNPRSSIGIRHCLDAKVKSNLQLKSVAYNGAFDFDVNGIYVSDSKGSKVTCNQTQDVSKGITFEGDCSASAAQPTDFLYNYLFKGNYGLVLQNAGKIGQQGNSTVAAANLFGNVGANALTSFHTGVFITTNVNVDSKLYVVNNTCPNTTTPNIPRPCNNGGTSSQNYILGTGILISSNIAAPSDPCGILSGRLITPGENTDSLKYNASQKLEMDIMDTVQQPIYNTTLKWMAKQYAFEQLHNFPELKNSTILADFYNNNMNTSIGKLALVNAAIQRGNFAQALNINNTITPSLLIEENHKRVNALSIARIIDTAYIYSDAEINELYLIAKQCNLEGGDAVMQARALYNFITNQSNLFLYDCNTTQTSDASGVTNRNEKVSTEDFASSKLVLYPNPNTGEFYIESNAMFGKQKIIQFFDINGKLVYTGSLPAEAKKHIVLLQNLDNGIYFYKINGDNKSEAQNGKIIIIK